MERNKEWKQKLNIFSKWNGDEKFADLGGEMERGTRGGSNRKGGMEEQEM